VPAPPDPFAAPDVAALLRASSPIVVVSDGRLEIVIVGFGCVAVAVPPILVEELPEGPLARRTFDHGNNFRAQAQAAGVENAFDFPGFVAAFIRPLFTERKGRFRWVALSGDPDDILRTDRAVLDLFPENAGLRRRIEMPEARIPFRIAYNINLASKDLDRAKRIARRIRESGGGLPRAQANGSGSRSLAAPKYR
jgi:Urocanase C-terminal domain/Urocanase Rossmann-like domain/Formiminotransferase domain